MNKKISVFLLAIVLIGYCESTHAQGRVMKPTHGMGWDCFQPRVPWLTTAPPYHSDMSLSCFIGYYYFDSLMRSLTGYSQLDSLMHQINSLDTLKPFLRYLYALNDYDARLFKQYRGEGYFVNPAYPFTATAVYDALEARMNAIIGPTSKTTFLVNCGPILHIIADNVEMTSHKYSEPRDTVHMFGCVWAHVLDTLKGKHFMTGDCFSGYHSKQSGLQPESTSPCINFSYDARYVRGSTNEVSDVKVDSTGLPINCTSCYGDSAVVVGGEYIVVLIPWGLGRDSVSDFYDYIPFTPFEATGGIFPVVGGMVHDPSNFFGYGTSVPIAIFESDLKADINTILSY